MYIPKDFSQTDEKEILFYLNKYPFGIFISNIDNIPYATHLPFTFQKTQDRLIIHSHLAKANPHSEHLNGTSALFIVQGPHTYISIKNYPSSQNIPTWNYIAVHLYGKTELIFDPEIVRQYLDELLEKHEKDALQQWWDADEKYKAGMLSRIVSFRLRVEKLECKEKLSQNRNKLEQKNIIGSLLKTRDTNKKEIAKYMIMNLKNHSNDKL